MFHVCTPWKHQKTSGFLEDGLIQENGLIQESVYLKKTNNKQELTHMFKMKKWERQVYGSYLSHIFEKSNIFIKKPSNLIEKVSILIKKPSCLDWEI